MLKKNKLKIVISSVIVLLPILFGIIMWNDLPDIMTTHWGADGNADGFSQKAFAVFGMPSILLCLHFACLLLTLLDKRQLEQNEKVLGFVFWIIPVTSVFTSGIMYCAAFGKEFGFELFLPALFGLLFIFIGNYLPKTKQNRTLGIKISWTLNNEENWNKTHRFGGKVWVIGGIILLFAIFLPRSATMWLSACVIAAMVIIPFAYSYHIYRQHKKVGIVYNSAPKSNAEKIAIRIFSVIIPITLIGTAVLMFSGNIEVLCNETSFSVNADYWTDLTVEYSQVDTLSYRSDLDVGARTNGFGSARLAMGTFRNQEFGLYTLYAYTGAEEFIVLTCGTKTLVLGMSDAEKTQAIYNLLLEKTEATAIG